MFVIRHMHKRKFEKTIAEPLRTGRVPDAMPELRGMPGILGGQTDADADAESEAAAAEPALALPEDPVPVSGVLVAAACALAAVAVFS